MTLNQRRGFITGGTWCVDHNRIVSHWPQEDGHAEYLEEVRDGGGSGCNFAVDIKRLDPAVPVETIAMTGDDDEGRFLRALADRWGIGRVQMHLTAEAGTQSADAFVSKATRRRTHIFKPGASNWLNPDHFDFSATRARYLHLGLPGVHRLLDGPWRGEVNGWVSVLKKARAAGLKTNLELASVGAKLIAALVRPCLAHLDMIIVNDAEIGALAGIETVTNGHTDLSACTRAAQAVRDLGAMALVVVHFPAAAIAVAESGAVIVTPSVRIPNSLIAGANGAGDAFAAGMLYGLHEGWEIEPALRLAHATAACSLRSLSTTGAIEPWQTALDLAQGWGWR